MALVQGEDSESDEEINTDQMHALALTPDGSLTKVQPSPPDVRKSAGIVAGEESETDDEDDEGSMEQTDSGQQVVVVPSNQTRSVSPVGSTRSSLDSSTPAPQSLLHKKLRETNVSLRRRIVNRILRLYRTICRNLTTVNDNLSKAQGTVEKVNSHLKQSDNELEQLNTILDGVTLDSKTFAPNIRIELPPPSPSRRKQLFKRSPDRSRSSPLPTAVTNEAHN